MGSSSSTVVCLLLTFGSLALATRCPGPDWYYRKSTDKCYFIQGNQGANVDATTGATTSAQMNWNQTIQECKMRGGKIVTFANAEELGWVQAKLLAQYKYYWTGLTFENLRWQWYDGESYTEYVKLGTLEDPAIPDPLYTPQLKRASLNYNFLQKKFVWYVELASTYNENSFICKGDWSTKPWCKVEAGWTYRNGSCYQYNPTAMTYNNAEKRCATGGGHLLVPSSVDEDNRVKNWLRNTLRVEKAWLGVAIRPKLATTTVSSVTWSDGSPLLGLPINDWETADMGQFISNMTNGKDYCGELSWSTVYEEDYWWSAGTLVVTHEWWLTSDCNTGVSRPFVCEAKLNKCPYGWTELDDTCYQFNVGESNLRTWPLAKAACESENAQLVMIKSAPEHQFVTYSNELLYSYSNRNKYWMGLQNRENSFSWVDNTVLSYTNWTGSPNPISGECVYIDAVRYGLSAGKWTTTLCTERMNYICQAPYTADIRPDEVIHPALACEAPFETFHDGCYLVVKQPMNRDAAQAYCQGNKSSVLGIVRTFGENVWLSERVTADSWIGLKIKSASASVSITTYNHEYSDGTPAALDSGSFKTFALNDNIGSTSGGSETTLKYCVAMAGINSTYSMDSYTFTTKAKRGEWYHLSCTESREFVCYHAGTPITVHPGHDSHHDPICGAGWFRNGDNCYRSYHDLAPWRSAKQTCQNTDPAADLLWITSKQEEKFIRDYIENNKTTEDWWDYYGDGNSVTGDNHWIGLYSASASGVWYWPHRNVVDKWHIPVSITNWDINQPAVSTSWSTSPRCALIEPDAWLARWSADRCDKSNAFICKKLVPPEFLVPVLPPTPRPTAAPGQVLGCKFGWAPFENRCIHHNPSIMSWVAARDFCRNQGGNLLSLQNAQELATVQQSARAGAWIGVNTLDSPSNPRIFSWSDGEPMTYTPFDSQSWNSTMNCGALTGVNGYSMYSCTEAKPSICTANQSSMNSSESTVTTAPAVAPVGCGPYAYAFRDRCFYFGVDPDTGPDSRPTFTFDAARDFCKTKYNAELATLSNTEQQAFVTSYTARLGMDFWIGLKESKTSWSPFDKWIDGIYMYSPNWAHLEPRKLESGALRCVALHGTYTDFIIPGDWYADDCVYPKRALCESARTINPMEPTAFRPPTTPGPSTSPKPTGGCPTGWKTSDGDYTFQTTLPKCYKAYLGKHEGEVQKVNWQDARDFCRSFRGGDLVSVESSFEKSFLSNTLLNSLDKNNQVWIGLRQNGPQSRWEWSDGRPWAGYENWHSSQDHQSIDPDCVAMEIYLGYWIPQSCDQAWGWICEIPRGLYSVNEMIENYPAYIAPNRTCGSATADGDWFFDVDSSECLYFSRKPDSFPSAQAVCRTMGSNLVTVTPQIHKFISLKANQFAASPTQYWIGLYQSDPLTQEYLWIDRHISLFRAWEQNEPTQSGNELCVSHNSWSGRWKDNRCNANLAYICHKSDRMPLTKPTVDPDVEATTTSCADDWSEFRGSCYFVSGPLNKTYQEADLACMKEITTDKGLPRGALVSIHSSLENDFLVSLARRRFSREDNQMYDLWIGLREYDNDNLLIWTDGTNVDYVNYLTPPSAFSYRNDCTYFGGGRLNIGRWSTVNCDISWGSSEKRSYICKAPKIQNRPPTPHPLSKCATDYTQYGENCFIVQELNTGEKTWAQAKARCQTIGDRYGDIATIVDIFENAEMRLLLNAVAHRAGFGQHNFSAWIGMQEHVGQYAWHNTCPIVWSNFENLYAKPAQNLTCGHMLADGKWDASSCVEEIDYVVCERRFEPCPAAFNMSSENLFCPDDFPHECSRSCYYIASGRSDRPMNNTWSTISQARANCTAKGGHLASIRTEEDQKCLNMYTHHITQGLWIGLYEKKIGETYSWVWENDEEYHPASTYVNWAPGKPTIYTYSRDICVEMLQNGQWTNRWCYDSQSAGEKGFVCERRKEYRAGSRGTSTLPPTAGTRLPPATTPAMNGYTTAVIAGQEPPLPSGGYYYSHEYSTKSGPSGGAVAGIVIGVLLAVFIVGAIAFVVVTGRTKMVMTSVRSASSKVKQSTVDRLSPGGRFSGFTNSSYNKESDQARVIDDPDYHGQQSDSYT